MSGGLWVATSEKGTTDNADVSDHIILLIKWSEDNADMTLKKSGHYGDALVLTNLFHSTLRL